MTEPMISCDRCERDFEAINLFRCVECCESLCADCLGPDALGWCWRCVEGARKPIRRAMAYIRSIARTA